MDIIVLVIIIALAIYYVPTYINTLSNKIDPSKYPLFPLEELRTGNDGIKEKNKKLTKEWKKMQNILENERTRRKIEINSDYSQPIKSSMKKHIQDEMFTLYIERDYRKKIEANLAILNGKSINEIEIQYNRFAA